MDDDSKNERIERDTTDIGRAARDLGEQNEALTTNLGREARIDEQMAVLQRERAAVESDSAIRRDRETDDERVIADRDRDLKEALASTTGTQPASPPIGQGPGTGPVSGPRNPPIVPPRRVG